MAVEVDGESFNLRLSPSATVDELYRKVDAHRPRRGREDAFFSLAAAAGLF